MKLSVLLRQTAYVVVGIYAYNQLRVFLPDVTGGGK